MKNIIEIWADGIRLSEYVDNVANTVPLDRDGRLKEHEDIVSRAEKLSLSSHALAVLTTSVIRV